MEKYISVKERLPEPNTKVICVLKNIKGEISYIINEMYMFKGNKIWKGSYAVRCAIIAWKNIDEYTE